jgi:hypothetical protein
VFHGSNLYRKDNPRWPIGNSAETAKVPRVTFELELPLGDPGEHSLVPRVRNACRRCVARAIGLPRRAGTRLHATTDAEARWWHWQVTERQDGLGRRYRDPRFDPDGGSLALPAPGPAVNLAGPGLAVPGDRGPGGR